MGGLITCTFRSRDLRVEKWRQYGLLRTSSNLRNSLLLVQTQVRAQGWNEPEALLSKLREYVVLSGAEQIHIRADTVLRDTLEAEGGGKGWG